MFSIEKEQMIKEEVKALTFCPHDLGSNFRSYVRQAGFMHQLYIAVSDSTDVDKGMRCSAMDQITDTALSWLDGHIPCECEQVRRMFDRIPGGPSRSTKPSKRTTRANRAVRDKRLKMTNFVHALPGALELEIQQLCHDTIELRIDFNQLTAQFAETQKKCQFLVQGAFQNLAVDRITGLPVSNREELDDFERSAAAFNFRRTIKEHCDVTWGQCMIDRLFTRDFLESWRKQEETSGRTIPFATYPNTMQLIHAIFKLRNPNITRLQAEKKFRKHIALLKQQENQKKE